MGNPSVDHLVLAHHKRVAAHDQSHFLSLLDHLEDILSLVNGKHDIEGAI